MPRVYIGRLSYHVREKDIQRFFSGYGKLMEIDLKNGYGFVEFEDNRDADDAVYELNGKELCGERVIVEHARGPRRDRDGYGGGYWGGGRNHTNSSLFWISRFERNNNLQVNAQQKVGSKVLKEHHCPFVYAPKASQCDAPSSGYSSSSSRSRSGRDKYGPPVRTEYRLIVENLSSRCSWQDLKDFMRQAGEVTYADAHKEHTNEGVIEFRTHSDMKRALDKLDGTDINGRKIRLVEDRSRKRRSYSGSRSRSRSRRRSRSRSRRSRSSHSRSRSRSRSRSGSNKRRNSRSRSGRKSRSRNRRSRSRSHKSKSRSGSRKSRSHSADRKSKSRSKSRSKVKSERDSRSRSKEGPGDKKSRSHSASPVENGKEERVARSASRSPSQHDDCSSKSREKRSASRSRSRSRSRSASQN